MIVGDTCATFIDRVKNKVNSISEIDEHETSTEAKIMQRVKEGVEFAHPSLHDLLDLVELDYKSFMSKVEKYKKPNLLVAEKVVPLVEKDFVPSVNYSSGGRDKKFDRGRDDESTRKCYGCGSERHVLRDTRRRIGRG